MPDSDGRGLVLTGLDGSNPLGFLAAIGTLRLLSDASAQICMGWHRTPNGWRPVLAGCGNDGKAFCIAIRNSLEHASETVFDIGKEHKSGKEHNKFPFSPATFAQALHNRQHKSSCSDRRDVDFLASFGTELYPDTKKNEFRDTSFRMVRSGDSNRQGMLYYAKALRERIDLDNIERALFHVWDYQDDGSYSLRWDPIEDQRYALRWRNPSKSSLTDGPGTMVAANVLAIEALRCFPTVQIGKQAHTTAFRRVKEHRELVWPIWTPMVGIDTVHSLLALRSFLETPVGRASLLARGIAEVYCADRVRPNQYYFNFAPAQPLA